MFTVINTNGSYFCYQNNPCMWTSEYYKYCVRLLTAALWYFKTPVNIILGAINHDFPNTNRTFKIDIQSEHTLVKLGGRSVDEEVLGNIDLLNEDGKYLIRIPNYKYYSELDATIEYSLPNLVNIGSNKEFSDYLETAIYIAPTLYDSLDFQKKERENTITMFSHNFCDRRDEFIRSVDGLNVNNVQGVFTKEGLKAVYDDTRIMINVHQTDHHHTLEELRVLPALCNGVIVISEEVPLKDSVPYSDSLVWSSYGDLAETIRDVQDNYEHYYCSIFTEQLESKLRQLQDDNIRNLIDKIG